MKYLIWAYDYSEASGGPKVLHRLCHELNEAGQEAYIGNDYATNPEWNTPHWDGPTSDVIAVYPEIVHGNPWGARRVARWVLNVPGLLGGDRTYAPDEMVFSFAERYLADVPLLYLPVFDLATYRDRHEPRSGALFYVGKGQRGNLPEPATEITLEMRLDRARLADAMNRATRLYSFDRVTGMAYIAWLCGCPVTYLPENETVAVDPDALRAQTRADLRRFRNQLAHFIETTQTPAWRLRFTDYQREWRRGNAAYRARDNERRRRAREQAA